jgi:hypothetical protein
VQQCPFYSFTSGCAALHHSQEVVHVNIPLAHWSMDMDMFPLARVNASRWMLQVGIWIAAGFSQELEAVLWLM